MTTSAISTLHDLENYADSQDRGLIYVSSTVRYGIPVVIYEVEGMGKYWFVDEHDNIIA
jgi:hypothetical protein